MSITRRTVLQKVRCRVVSLQIRSSTACKHRVSGSLSLPSRGPFHLSITVLFAIAHLVVFRLGGWSPRLPARFPVSRGTLDPAPSLPLSLTGLSPSPAGFPNAILLASAPFSQSSTPNHFRRSVWPLSLSLAATQKITQLCSAALLFRIQDFHLLWLAFPCHSARYLQYRTLSEPREYFYSRFGLFRFRSPLLAESRLISFPRPT